MVSGRVGADVQSVRDVGVGPALCKEGGYFEFPTRKPVSVLQVCGAPLRRTVPAASASLVPKLAAKLPHLAHRFAQLTEEQLAVSTQIGECGQKIAQPIVRDGVYAA
jgi:hypothetical protein